MKLTIEIPDAHTGSLLQFLATLTAQGAPAGSLAAKPVRFAILDELHKAPEIDEPPIGPAVLDPDGQKPTLAESMADAAGLERPTSDDDADLRWAVVGELEETTTEPVKALDWPALPEGITAPPEGFAFVTMEKLKVSSADMTTDIMTYTGFSWDDNAPNGWHGSVEGPWAVRIGSDIAKANGIV